MKEVPKKILYNTFITPIDSTSSIQLISISIIIRELQINAAREHFIQMEEIEKLWVQDHDITEL